MTHEDAATTPDLWNVRPVPEPASLVEQDARTDEVFDRDVLSPAPEGLNLTPMGVGLPVTQEHVDRFTPVLPRSVLHIWRRFGFDGFSGGVFWITDPLLWAPVVQAWLDPVIDQMPFTDTWHCLARNAMGSMFLWGENTGHSLEIDPVYHEVIVDQLARRTFADPGRREQQGRVAIVHAADTGLTTALDEHGRPLPPQALERLGPLRADQVYGFTLPPALGGALSVDNLHIIDAATYLTLQAQQTTITVCDPVGDSWNEIAPVIHVDPTTRS